MLHFFLHGWKTSIDSEKNRIFFQNICKEGDRILVLPFAFDKAAWQESFEAIKTRCIKYNPDKHIMFTCANDESNALIQQIIDHDVLYFSWWLEDGHLRVMQQISELEKIFQNKRIVWISAGANMLATSYYTQDFEKVEPGLKILPIKIICHRWSDYSLARTDAERLADLEAYGEPLPVYKIPEQEYIEMEI